MKEKKSFWSLLRKVGEFNGKFYIDFHVDLLEITNFTIKLTSTIAQLKLYVVKTETFSYAACRGWDTRFVEIRIERDVSRSI